MNRTLNILYTRMTLNWYFTESHFPSIMYVQKNDQTCALDLLPTYHNFEFEPDLSTTCPRNNRNRQDDFWISLIQRNAFLGLIFQEVFAISRGKGAIEVIA